MTRDHEGVDDDAPPGIEVLLSDPSLWADPSPALESAVARLLADARVAAVSPPPAEIVEIPSRRRGRPRRLILAAAAGVVIMAGVAGAGVVALRGGGDQGEQLSAPTFEVILDDPAPGSALLRRTESGWRIDLDVANLPRRADGEFYEAWLASSDGRLVSIGTFNEGTSVIVWAGVSPETFTTLSITRELADGEAASSGDVVVVGPVTRR